MDTFSTRIKFVRNYTGMDRKEFSHITGFSVETIKSWENKPIVPHTKSLKLLVQNLNNSKILIKYEWLKDGVGIFPYNPENSTKNNNIHEEDIFILRNPDSILFPIDTHDYSPFLYPGDVVGGTLKNKISNITYVILNCPKKDLDIFIAHPTEDDNVILMPINLQRKKPILVKDDMKLYEIKFLRRK